MADILQDLKFDYGWIWANNPKSGKTLAQILEDALAKFKARFATQPSFALVHLDTEIDETIPEKFEFPVYQSRYVLKNTIILGVARDTVPAQD